MRSRLEQLRDTVEFAVANIPWYRDRAESYRIPLDGPADLARLPIIDRASVLAHPELFASGDQWPSGVTYSSATTGAVGQPRWRSPAEATALANLMDGASTPDDGSAMLVIHPFDQGPPVVPATSGHRVYSGMLVPWHFELIHRLLADGVASPRGGPRRITTIDCFSPGLRILTEWFTQRGIEPRRFGVKVLVGYGSIQPSAWRRRLEDTWGARYLDIYGLSEVILSDAPECGLCRARHFPLPVIPEVVDLLTRQPISQGTGILVLSELHPYAQLQLLLRYWTDDLVELARPCPLGHFGFRFRGRRSSSAVITRGGAAPLVVGSLQVGEVCAEIPDVAVTPIAWAPWAADVGAPRFALATKGPTVEVTVALRYSPATFPERAREVADHLTATLSRNVTGLGEAVAAGEVRLITTTVASDRLPAATTI